MSDTTPILCWLRRDLRLADNPMLYAAAMTGRPVIPVFINDETVSALGAAPQWRLGRAIAAFAEALEGIGARLVLRRGAALEVLRALIDESGAGAVWWGRQYDRAAIARDRDVKAALVAGGIDARSFAGHLLHEPWTVETGQGSYYKVYTPFWRAVKDRDVPAPDPAPASLPAPVAWPRSDALSDWRMSAAMDRGAAVVAVHACVGEAAARERLDGFVAERIAGYKARRDMLAEDATSLLSENLTHGEIGPRTVWRAAMAARADGAAGAEAFAQELVWRDFAWHLTYHTPHIAERNWRSDWEDFPWRGDNADAEGWRRGRTGVAVVDAAMREMYVTGRMHNRARMIVASFLTKHLLTHWRIGLDWFADCLIDWDPASNALGWQWAAGSGPDAAPYFRIFNPETQAQKFDPDAAYRRRWVAELSDTPPATALSYFDAIPRSWGLVPDAAYPEPAIGLKAGRERALAAYHASRA